MQCCLPLFPAFLSWTACTALYQHSNPLIYPTKSLSCWLSYSFVCVARHFVLSVYSTYLKIPRMSGQLPWNLASCFPLSSDSNMPFFPRFEVLYHDTTSINTGKGFSSFRKMRKGSFLRLTFHSFSTNFAVLRLLLCYSKDEDSNIWFCVAIMAVFICEIWSPIRAKRDVVGIQIAVHRCPKPIKFHRIFGPTYRNIQVICKAISFARQCKEGQKHLFTFCMHLGQP